MIIRPGRRCSYTQCVSVVGEISVCGMFSDLHVAFLGTVATRFIALVRLRPALCRGQIARSLISEIARNCLHKTVYCHIR